MANLNRRDFMVLTGGAFALASSGTGIARALSLSCGMPGVTLPGSDLSPDQVTFLLGVEQDMAQFFWNQGSTLWTNTAAGGPPQIGGKYQASGLISNKADSTQGLPVGNSSSIAVVGFGLAALCIVANRLGTSQPLVIYKDGGVPVTATDIQARVKATLQSLLASAAYNGFLFHYIDQGTGQSTGSGNVCSTGDNALLLGGVLVARQYYKNIDPTIYTLASTLYANANWQSMMDPATKTYWLSFDGSSYSNAHWGAYSAVTLPLLLGLGSNSYPLDCNPTPASPDGSKYPWDALYRPTYLCGSYSNSVQGKWPDANYQFVGCPTSDVYIGSPSSLFVHQYPQAYFNLYSTKDQYADYFQNSRMATDAHAAWCKSYSSQFKDFYTKKPYIGDGLWGVTASSSNVNNQPTYEGWGGPPPTWDDGGSDPWDGTLVPCAPGGSLAFLPSRCCQALQNMKAQYPKSYPTFQSGPYRGQSYGFLDAFNPATDWYSPNFLGIDVGITMLMAENAISGFVWNMFMRNSEAGAALAKAGFVSK